MNPHPPSVQDAYYAWDSASRAMADGVRPRDPGARFYSWGGSAADWGWRGSVGAAPGLGAWTGFVAKTPISKHIVIEFPILNVCPLFSPCLDHERAPRPLAPVSVTGLDLRPDQPQVSFEKVRVF